MPLVLLALSAALASAPDDIAQPADACLPPPDAELAWQAAGLFEDSVFDDSLFDDAVVFAPGGLSSDQLSEALSFATALILSALL